MRVPTKRLNKSPWKERVNFLSEDSTVTIIEHIDYLATMDDAQTEWQNGYIVIQNGVIQAVGTGTPDVGTATATRISGRGCIATPGLINTHHHLFQTVTRVLVAAQNVRLIEWKRANFRYWSFIDEEAVYVTALVALSELALSGCSLSSDLLYVFPVDVNGTVRFMQSAVAAAHDVGMRFQPTRGGVDFSLDTGGAPPDRMMESTDDVLLGMERAIQQFHDPSPGSMCRVGIAPNSLTMCTPRLWMESRDLAKKYGVTRHTHVAEFVEELEYFQETMGMRPIARLAELGWIESDVWLAHVVHASLAEIDLLAANGTGVSHCPSSNMRLGSGIAPVRDMLDRGVCVGIGVDGSASNDGGNLLGEARLAMLLSRVSRRDRLTTAREVLRMATVGGAQILGRTDVGRIQVGMQADIALYEPHGVSAAGTEHDPIAALVLAWPPRVKHLMVQGRFVVENGALVHKNETDLRQLHQSVVKKLQAQLQ